MEKEVLIAKIKELKADKRAVILSHYYQCAEIQALADFVGDSLALAQRATTLDADYIVMCGVMFMAETVKLLCPHARVFSLDAKIGCFLADSCKYEDLKKFKKDNPDFTVVSYINSSTLVKTLTDYTVTSSNAVKVVNSIESDKILFCPDKNLGAYINARTGKQMRLWDGCCRVHDEVMLVEVLHLKNENASAPILAHPECSAEIIEVADYVGSTAGIINFVRENAHAQYIVCTEPNILYQLRSLRPSAQFFSPVFECVYMQMNTLEKLYNTLLNDTFEVKIEAEIARKAVLPVNRMLSLS